jgi:hypothetical protein
MQLSSSLGTVALPGAFVLASHSEISRRCEAYAREKAGDELLAGKAPSLDALQQDIDACASRLDTGRQILQALILSLGLGAAAYFGTKIWRPR